MSQRTSTPSGAGSRKSGGSPRNWYQTRFALAVVSIIVAAIIVLLTWPWEEVLERDQATFCFAYEVELVDEEEPQTRIVTQYRQEIIPKGCERYAGDNHYVADTTESPDVADPSAAPDGEEPRAEDADTQRLTKRSVAWIAATVEGPRRHIERLKDQRHRWSAIHGTVDPTSDAHGWQSVEVNAENERAKIEELDPRFRRVKFLGTRAQTIDYKVESLKTRTLAVEVVREGNPPEGFQIIRVRVEPSHVDVRAPESELERRSSLQTAPVNLAEITDTSTRFAREIRLPSTFALLEGEPDTVDVRVDVRPTKSSLLLPPLEIQLRNNKFADGILHAVPASISLQAHIDVNLIEDVDEEDSVSMEQWKQKREDCVTAVEDATIEAFIDVQGVEHTEDVDKDAHYTVTVEGLPECVLEKEFTPEKAALRIEKTSD